MDVQEDIQIELSNYGELEEYWIVKTHQATIGAQAGSMFCTFKEINMAQEAYEQMNGRKYDGNELKLIYIRQNLYEKEFFNKKNLKPPHA